LAARLLGALWAAYTGNHIQRCASVPGRTGDATANEDARRFDDSGGAPLLTNYLIFGICAALGAVMLAHWCYRWIVEHRSGRGGRRW
jgi:hypothetical protein